MSGPIVSGKDPHFEKTLYKPAGQPGSWTRTYYLSHGGYLDTRKEIQYGQDGEIEEVKNSGLRGRGRAGCTIGLK